MQGVDAKTGQHLSGLDHLRQSIADILSTRLGTRVMRRGYGSRLYELIDAPVNDVTIILMYSAIVESLMIWEPRIEVLRVEAESVSSGKIVLAITGKYLPSGQEVRLEGVEVSR